MCDLDIYMVPNVFIIPKEHPAPLRSYSLPLLTTGTGLPTLGISYMQIPSHNWWSLYLISAQWVCLSRILMVKNLAGNGCNSPSTLLCQGLELSSPNLLCSLLQRLLWSHTHWCVHSQKPLKQDASFADVLFWRWVVVKKSYPLI